MKSRRLPLPLRAHLHVLEGHGQRLALETLQGGGEVAPLFLGQVLRLLLGLRVELDLGERDGAFPRTADVDLLDGDPAAGAVVQPVDGYDPLVGVQLDRPAQLSGLRDVTGGVSIGDGATFHGDAHVGALVRRRLDDAADQVLALGIGERFGDRVDDFQVGEGLGVQARPAGEVAVHVDDRSDRLVHGEDALVSLGRHRDDVLDLLCVEVGVQRVQQGGGRGHLRRSHAGSAARPGHRAGRWVVAAYGLLAGCVEGHLEVLGRLVARVGQRAVVVHIADRDDIWRADPAGDSTGRRSWRYRRSRQRRRRRRSASPWRAGRRTSR